MRASYPTLYAPKSNHKPLTHKQSMESMLMHRNEPAKEMDFPVPSSAAESSERPVSLQHLCVCSNAAD